MHGHEMTIVKIIPGEEFQQHFEQQRNTDSVNVAVQGDHFEGERNY
jgi:hypothetical protein